MSLSGLGALPNFTANDTSNFDIEALRRLVQERVAMFAKNKALEDYQLLLITLAYILLIAIGVFGNVMVCLAIRRNPQMKTPRNLLILNLTISDLFLCFFTIPFSLIEIALKFWPLGTLPCKLTAGFEAVPIFVSTITIMSIAFDRYVTVVHPKQESYKLSASILKLAAIWGFALLLSMPLFLYREVDVVLINLPGITSVSYCIENWPTPHGRGYYSLFTICVQYLLPITILSLTYSRVYRKINERVSRRKLMMNNSAVTIRRLTKKSNRTNNLLMSIAVVFGVSWLPINILNLVCDFGFHFDSDVTFRIVFALCHMVAMSSAITNPFLYGWFNGNFRAEFKELFDIINRKFGFGCFSWFSLCEKQITLITRPRSLLVKSDLDYSIATTLQIDSSHDTSDNNNTVLIRNESHVML